MKSMREWSTANDIESHPVNEVEDDMTAAAAPEKVGLRVLYRTVDGRILTQPFDFGVDGPNIAVRLIP